MCSFPLPGSKSTLNLAPKCESRWIRFRGEDQDCERLKALVAQSDATLGIESQSGTPPDNYVLVFHCRSIARLNGDVPVFAESHRLKFTFPAEYPGTPPKITVLTPIFHPHVFQSNNTFCLLDHRKSMRFYLVNEYLDKLVLRIGAMLQYDPSYIEVASPANGGARDWFVQNRRRLPLGRVSFGADRSPPQRPISWTDV